LPESGDKSIDGFVRWLMSDGTGCKIESFWNDNRKTRIAALCLSKDGKGLVIFSMRNKKYIVFYAGIEYNTT